MDLDQLKKCAYCLTIIREGTHCASCAIGVKTGHYSLTPKKYKKDASGEKELMVELPAEYPPGLTEDDYEKIKKCKQCKYMYRQKGSWYCSDLCRVEFNKNN